MTLTYWGKTINIIKKRNGISVRLFKRTGLEANVEKTKCLTLYVVMPHYQIKRRKIKIFLCLIRHHSIKTFSRVKV
jgi:hypothetical protein